MHMYDSQIEIMWEKLMTEGSERKPTFSRAKFDDVVSSFIQAEDWDEGPLITEDIRMFRAESNIFMYYFGEHQEFPGLDPGRALPFDHTAANPEAIRMRAQIEQMWAGRTSRSDYQPQLGWNPTTGEPWLAVRSYAENSYPALSGTRHSFLYKVQLLMPEFRLQYERFPHLGYTLIWPEFSDTANMANQGTWKRLGQFRAFVEGWAAIRGNAPHIHGALKLYLEKNERQRLQLPDGFVFDQTLLRVNNQPVAATTQVFPGHRQSLSRRHEGKDGGQDDMGQDNQGQDSRDQVGRGQDDRGRASQGRGGRGRGGRGHGGNPVDRYRPDYSPRGRNDSRRESDHRRSRSPRYEREEGRDVYEREPARYERGESFSGQRFKRERT